MMSEINMNAFIKTDIENAVILMRAAIMNALDSLEKGEEKKIEFDAPIPLQLIIKYAKERGWKEDLDMDWDWTNGWEVDYWYTMAHSNREDIYLSITGSLLCGNTSLALENNE